MEVCEDATNGRLIFHDGEDKHVDNVAIVVPTVRREEKVTSDWAEEM